MNKDIKLEDLGLKDFKDTWDYQETLFKAILDTKIKNRRESKFVLFIFAANEKTPVDFNDLHPCSDLFWM